MYPDESPHRRASSFWEMSRSSSRLQNAAALSMTRDDGRLRLISRALTLLCRRLGIRRRTACPALRGLLCASDIFSRSLFVARPPLNPCPFSRYVVDRPRCGVESPSSVLSIAHPLLLPDTAVPLMVAPASPVILSGTPVGNMRLILPTGFA